jgi:Cytochrome C oxidase, cbb3-type, subunit III
MKRALAIAVMAACAHPQATLSLTPGPSFADVRAEQIVEQGDLAYVFGHDRITIARGGLATNVVSITCGNACPDRVWTSAASIPALDGDGRWIVATRYDGTLWRVTMSGELESIGDRFRAGDKVMQVDSAGPTIALALAGATGITTDGVHVARYPITGELAVARDRLAVATEHATELWDLAKNTRLTFPVTGHPAFLDGTSPEPRLVVMQPDALWYARGGVLHRVSVPAHYAAVVAGAQLWLRDGNALYVMLDDVLRKTDAQLTATDAVDTLLGSPSGDVWLGAKSGVRRFSLARTIDDSKWTAQVQPVFAHVCAHCHLPGGSADVDLSSAATWTSEHDELVRRVIVTRTMPPAGTSLSDSDRAALAAWLGVQN